MQIIPMAIQWLCLNGSRHPKLKIGESSYFLIFFDATRHNTAYSCMQLLDIVRAYHIFRATPQQTSLITSSAPLVKQMTTGGGDYGQGRPA
jgi:hypothetical protein